MRTMLIASAVVLTGLFTFAMPRASAAPSIGIHTLPTIGMLTQIYYGANGRHWHHRNWSHGHWRYFN